MKRARFTEEQIIGVVREHEAGAKTADLARKHGVLEATLYNWMKQNADGSVDLYFGPKAPAGFEKNWVTTAGRNFFLIFRLYGPEKTFFNKSWKLPEVEKVQ